MKLMIIKVCKLWTFADGYENSIILTGVAIGMESL